MRWRWLIGLGLGWVGLALSGGAVMADRYESPPYRVVMALNGVEIREYAPVIEARVVAKGDFERATNEGFRILADYIFGNNQPGAKIAMTVPVAATPGQNLSGRDQGQKIAMTVPVASTPLQADEWTVAFTMPSEWTRDTLPQPRDPRVMIVQTQPEMRAVLGFSGRGNPENFEGKTEELMQWVAEQGWQVVGAPIHTQFDPPWTLPPLRKNEVWIPVAPPSP